MPGEHATRLRLDAGTTTRDFYRGRRVVIVGADGFIGRFTARALIALEAEVTLLTRTPSGSPAPSPSRRIVGDIADLAVARAAVEGQSVVFDLIGATSAVLANRDPGVSLVQECLPHLNLLAACADAPSPPLVVFPSSRLVYGTPAYLPVDEAHPTAPLTIYGVHKLTVEGYLSVYMRTRGVPYVVFRISNPYGPHRSATNKGYGVVNQFIARAARGEPIRIFGDGSQTRDYIFAEDLIELILRATVEPSCYGQTFNVGGEEPISLRRVAELIAAAAGGTRVECVPWPPEHRLIETGSYIGSLEKLGRHIVLPTLTPIAEGLGRSLDAYRRDAC